MAAGAEPKRWQLIDAVFQHAADLPREKRAAYLDEACKDQPDVRAAVEGLLANLSAAGASFMEQPAAANAASLLAMLPEENADNEPPVQRLGAYRITREIGRGGMGTVFEAVRDDGTFAQHVAIKLIRRGLDSAEVIARFRLERQILAMVNHPNIGRLLDGGTSPDGRPFFVMELITGKTLMEYCRTGHVDLRERLRLFLEICAAVSHAHQHLIIHRDLKPANIMVATDASGKSLVKLLDFGIAKMLQAGPAEMSQTQPANQLLTPDYASPEQVRGEAVTTATDVYALGLILFELLTGRKAQRATSSARADIEQAVCQTMPAKPSDLTLEGVAHSATNLRGDLDNIVLKALQKEPARRYQSVTQFAEDVERFLSGHPVIARPDSFGYRLSKFVSRNRWGVAVGAALLLAVAGGVYSTMAQARIAREHFDSVRGLSKSLIHEIDDAAIAVPGTTKTRQLIVQRSIEYLDKLSKNTGDDPDLMMELADAYRTVATIQGNRNRSNIGDYQGAMVSFRKSLDLHRRVERIRPALRNRMEIPLTASEAARVFPGTQESNELATEAIRVAESLAKENPGKFKLALGSSYFTKGYLHSLREEPEETIEAMQRTRQLYLEMKRSKNNLAVCDRYTAQALMMMGKHKEAEEKLRGAIVNDEENVKTKPTPRARMDLSYNYTNLAKVMIRQGRMQEAQSNLDIAVRMRKEMAAADPGDLRAQMSLLETDHLQGIIHTRTGKLAAGEALLQKARESLAGFLKKDPESLEDAMALAQGNGDLAHNYRLAGRCAEADDLLAAANKLLAGAPMPYTRKLLAEVPACVGRR